MGMFTENPTITWVDFTTGDLFQRDSHGNVYRLNNDGCDVRVTPTNEGAMIGGGMRENNW